MTDNSTLITKVAKAMLNGVYNRKTAWDEFPEDHLSFERKATHALEFLASTGRLVPDDDDVIDAEVYGLRKNGDWLLGSSELDDLRIAWEAVKGYRVDGYARPHVNRLVEVVGRLFAETAPAECEFRCEEGIARAAVGVRCPACTAAIRASVKVSGNIVAEVNSSPTVVHVHHHDIEAHAASFNEGYDEAVRQLAEPVDTIRNFPRCGHYLDEARCTRRIHDGDHESVQGDEVIVWPAGEPDPEPAEEEAEAVTRCPICFGLNGSHNTIHERYPTGGGGTNKPCPNSSPVVPAPSKTGPWPSIEKVPTGLVVIGTNGERFMGCPCESETHGYANQFAPFVAMKER